MDYEKKYKEALELAIKAKNNASLSKGTLRVLRIIFPELKEFEDERIRKAILTGLIDCRDAPDLGWSDFGGIAIEDCIAWLKKQGEQKLADKVEPKFNVGDTMRTLQEANNGYTDGMPVVVSIDNEYYHCTNELIAIKDQDNYEFPPINVKQKPTDNTEPKFHEGDWIISNNKKATYQVIEVKRGIYVIRDNADNHEYHIGIEQCEKSGRLWNISDAKNGDVLFSDLMCGKTFIYNGINPDMAILYSFIISNDGEDVLPYHIGKPNTGIGNIEENKNIIHPATKEQRDLLFQKMKEAGYEWDENKKELRKIEQKSKWSDEDEDNLNLAIYHIRCDDIPYSPHDIEPIVDWLKTIKQRMEEQQ